MKQKIEKKLNILENFENFGNFSEKLENFGIFENFKNIELFGQKKVFKRWAWSQIMRRAFVIKCEYDHMNYFLNRNKHNAFYWISNKKTAIYIHKSK